MTANAAGLAGGLRRKARSRKASGKPELIEMHYEARLRTEAL
jgi:hypothetical protein